MASHEELVGELPKLERLSNAARLKHARKRRAKQMKWWGEWLRQQRATNGSVLRKQTEDKVQFEVSALLTDLVIRNDIIGVQKVLESGGDPNISNADGLTPLHKCCIDNTVELAEVLLEHSADLNARDVEGWTPLHAAAATGNIPMITLLLDNGASLVAINHDDKLPVDVACDGDIRYILQQKMLEAGYTEDVVEYIHASVPKTMLADLKDSVRNERSLNLQDKYGSSALHVASANGYTEVLQFLLPKEGLNLNIQDNEGWTPLHAAVCWGQKEAMRMLVEKGANMDAKNLRGETPYAIAEDADIRQYMLELRGEFGRDEEVEIENVGDDMEPIRRGRRLSVKRTRQEDKDVMAKQSMKSEAHMRRMSLKQQDAERDIPGLTGSAAVKDICADDDEDANVTLLSVRSAEDSTEQSGRVLENLDLEDNPKGRLPRKSALKRPPPTPVSTYTSSPPTSPSGYPPRGGAGSRGIRECCSIL